MRTRTPEQRRVYAAGRMSLAVDRLIRGEQVEKARGWARRWACAAGLGPYVSRYR